MVCERCCMGRKSFEGGESERVERKHAEERKVQEGEAVRVKLNIS